MHNSFPAVGHVPHAIAGSSPFFSEDFNRYCIIVDNVTGVRVTVLLQSLKPGSNVTCSVTVVHETEHKMGRRDKRRARTRALTSFGGLVGACCLTSGEC